MIETYMPVLKLVNKFFEYDPEVAAHILETMDEEEAVEILKALPPSLSAQIFRYLEVHYAAKLLKEAPPDTFKEIVSRLEPQNGAAIFRNIPDDIRKKLLEHLPEKTRRQIRELLIYPRDSVGSIMSTDFLALHTDIKVKDAIEKIRSMAHTKSPASYVYIIDSDNHLVGVLNMRDLLLADENATLESVMIKDVFSLNAFTDREEAANEVARRRFFAAPVVDNENHLLGIVKADQLINQIQDEATEDIQKMFGAGGDERISSPISFSLKKRLPWLHINLATAFLAASVVNLFEDIIAKITVLAVFLPIVAGQGGNAGSQSLAVVMRGLIMREISTKEIKRLVFRETKIGILNGVATGTVTALISWLWKGNAILGLVIGLAMVVNLAIAGLAGALIPVSMKAIGLDPAQSSSIILTTITDVVGFFAFLGLAVMFQGLLV
ncbi:MAG: magnesium transporter MgtE [Deltaproteobacteria bacterium]|nr:MAG: magnesium transporter MgtE [Deltaproteobacteria bacterium]